MIITESIFGTEAPKFVFDSNTYLLDHVIVVSDNAETEFIRHESIINRHREWVPRGTHWLFELNLFLFKYADPAAEYALLKAVERQIVTQLFKRRDGIAFEDSANANVPFLLESITETYVDRDDYPDVLSLRFISADPVVMEKSAIAP